MLFGREGNAMAIALLLLLIAQAEPAQSSAEWYKARVEEERPKQITRLSEWLAENKRKLAFAKQGRIVRGRPSVLNAGSRFEFPTPESKRETIARMEETIEKTANRIAGLRDRTEDPAIAIDPRNLKIGHVGVLNQPTIMQVVSGRDALVKIFWADPIADETVWLELESTQGLADGKEHDFKGLFEVTGTKVYQSRSGPRSVFVLRPFEMPKPVTAPPQSCWRSLHRGFGPAAPRLASCSLLFSFAPLTASQS